MPWYSLPHWDLPRWCRGTPGSLPLGCPSEQRLLRAPPNPKSGSVSPFSFPTSRNLSTASGTSIWWLSWLRLPSETLDWSQRHFSSSVNGGPSSSPPASSLSPTRCPMSEASPLSGPPLAKPLLFAALPSCTAMSLLPQVADESSFNTREGMDGSHPPRLGPSAGFHSLGIHLILNKHPEAMERAAVCWTTLLKLNPWALPLSKATAAMLSVRMICFCPKLLSDRRWCWMACSEARASYTGIDSRRCQR